MGSTRLFLTTTLLLTFCVTLISTQEDASATPKCAADTSTCATLHTLHDTFDSLSKQDQMQAVQLFAAFAYLPALPTLQRCALQPDPTLSPLCTQALLVHAQPESLPTLRSIVRTPNTTPQSVQIAAQALQAVQDPFAHSLYLRALLHATHSPETNIVLSNLLLQTDLTWRTSYLHFIMRHTSQPKLRNHLALLLSSRLRTTQRDEPTTLLHTQLHTVLTQSTPLTTSQTTLLETLPHALSTASDTACDTLLSTLRIQLSSPTRALRTRAARAHSNASKRCTTRSTYPVPPSLVLVSSSTLSPKPTHQAQPANAPDPSTALLHNQLRNLELTWDTPAILRHTRRRLRWRSPSLAQRRKTLSNTYPDRFETAQLDTEQPAWWPSEMVVTIDDGPRPDTLEKILNTLDKYQVKALFFFVGSSLVRRSIEEPERLRNLLQRLLDQGHEIGYHSMNHETLKSKRLLTRDQDQLRDDVESFRAVLHTVTGRTVALRYGRTPGGHGSKTGWMRAGFYHAGLRAPLSWTAGPPEWTPDTPHDQLPALAARLARREDPQVILLHESPGLDRELQVFFNALKSIH